MNAEPAQEQMPGERCPFGAEHMLLVERVASSRHFAKAPKLQHFLRYIAQHSSDERPELITEAQIGVQVFKRKESYHPGEDNIVRSYARTLRKRLEEYFATDGIGEDYILQVPRGGYFLEVNPRPAKVLVEVVVPLSLQPITPAEEIESSSEKAGNRWRNLTLCVAATLPFLLVCAYLLGRRGSSAPTSSKNIHAFWTAFLGDRPIVVVPSDTGLTVVLGLTQQDTSLTQYASNQYLRVLAAKYPQLAGWERPISHRYSDFVDVTAIHQFDETPEISRHRMTVVYPRDLKADEFKNHSVLLIGGHNANPWVDLYDTKLNFRLHFDADRRIFQVENHHPLPGEPALYPYDIGGAMPYAYGLIAVIPNLTNTGYVLLLEGVTNSGLQAAISALADERLMALIAGQVVRSDNTIQPAEFLVRTIGVGGDSTGVEIIGQRPVT